ncbi:restriction endonuclease subunit S [Rhodopirellula baltica]
MSVTLASSQVEPPPWESPQWQEAVSQNPGLAPFFDNLESFVELPEGVEKLRNVFLRLAVQGKLVAQDPSDEPADSLMERALSERKEIIKKYRLRSTTEFEPIANDEQPYELPNGWRWCRFGEFGAFMGGGTPSKGNSAYWSGDIPWVTPKDMKRPLIEDAIDHVSQEGVDNSSAKLIPLESLLIVVRGMILIHSFPIAISKRELTINQDMKAIVLGEKQLANYLLLLGQASRDRMLEVVQRSSHGTCRIATEDVERFVVGLPPLAEQRRIVSKVEGLMSLCDTLESQRRSRESVRERASRSVLASLTIAPPATNTSPQRKQEIPTATETLASAWQRLSDHFDVLLDQPETVAHLRQSILQLAVQGKLVLQDPNDEPASELISEIAARKKELVDAKEIAKPKKLPAFEPEKLPFDLPVGWEWVRLESVCEVITKGSSPKWQGVSYVDTPEGGIMFVTSENVGNYVMRKMDTPKYVEEKFNEMEPRSILQRGDILVNLVGASIGRSAMWDRDDVANINQAVGIVRLVPDCRTVSRRYLLDYLNSPTCLEIMLGNRVTTAQPNISLSNVKHFPVPIPPEAEQKRIVSKVSVLLSQLDELSARLRSRQFTTDALLTALIHRILDGES